MDLLNELADLNIAPAAMAKVQALFEQQQAKLAEKDFKITALTHELAYYRPTPNVSTTVILSSASTCPRIPHKLLA